MEQWNNLLPASSEEEIQNAEEASQAIKPLLLDKVRQKFEITGWISLVFGIFFTASFFRARIGLNALIFTMIMIFLLNYFMRKFKIPVKTATKMYYLAALLTGLSSALTSSGALQFFNTLAAIILLELSLLHQLYDDGRWSFIKQISKMLGILFRGIASLGMPFTDGVHFFKRSRLVRNEKIWNVIFGIIIALPILLIITALLSSADLLFGRMTKSFFEFLASFDIIAVIIMILFGFLSCYLIFCGAAAQVGKAERKERKKADASIAGTAMTLICVLYLVFCFLQIAYLFAGGWFSLPEGMTYAQYARKGFFELLFVSIINIVLMLITAEYFEGSRFLRLLLITMTICTYIMTFSAAYRMLLYIRAYHLTFLRLFVLLCLLIITLLLAGMLVSVYRRGFPLFRYFTGVIVICYLVFSFARPDYWIADYYIKHEERISYEDSWYLTQQLSLDAAPKILPLLSEKDRFGESIRQLKELYYKNIGVQNTERGIRDYNISCRLAEYYAEQYRGK